MGFLFTTFLTRECTGCSLQTVVPMVTGPVVTMVVVGVGVVLCVTISGVCASAGLHISRSARYRFIIISTTVARRKPSTRSETAAWRRSQQ
jgi:hypothetical protein